MVKSTSSRRLNRADMPRRADARGSTSPQRGDVRLSSCLTKDREPCSHSSTSLPSTGTICARQTRSESVFATVRHRTVRTKGALSAKTAKLMVFKLVNAAAKTWRRLKGENQLPKIVQGVKFKNGIEVTEMPAHHAA